MCICKCFIWKMTQFKDTSLSQLTSQREEEAAAAVHNSCNFSVHRPQTHKWIVVIVTILFPIQFFFCWLYLEWFVFIDEVFQKTCNKKKRESKQICVTRIWFCNICSNFFLVQTNNSRERDREGKMNLNEQTIGIVSKSLLLSLSLWVFSC